MLSLWWLILCDSQRAEKTSFLAVSDVSGREKHLSHKLREEYWPHQWGWASSNPLLAQMEENGRRTGNSLPPRELLCISSPVSVSLWFSGLRTLTGAYTVGSLVLRPLGLNRSYTTCFPVPPSQRQQIVGLRFCNRLSQSFIVNLFLWIFSYILLLLLLWKALINTIPLNLFRFFNVF